MDAGARGLPNVNAVKRRGLGGKDRNTKAEVMEINSGSTHVQGTVWCFVKGSRTRQSRGDSAMLHVEPAALAVMVVVQDMAVMAVVQDMVVMPYVDGRVPSAIEETGPGMGQPCLPCVLPVEPTCPKYRCAE